MLRRVSVQFSNVLIRELSNGSFVVLSCHASLWSSRTPARRGQGRGERQKHSTTKPVVEIQIAGKSATKDAHWCPNAFF